MKKVLLLVYILIGFSLPAGANVSPSLAGFADVVEPLMPAVVNIYTVQYRNNTNAQKLPSPFEGMPFDPFSKFFEQFDMQLGADDLYSDPKATALGSGFIIDPAGYIVTNHHVISGADEINVKLNDNTELSAKLIGSDPKTDLALLKVDSKKQLPCVKFGDSSKARVGDLVIAIGNPFGLGGTVTTGIVSSKGRDINADASGIVDDFIQTDAAINSGNSGGPMFNIEGEVIGVNTAILSPSGTNTGIGFAIPSSTAETVVAQLKEYGKVSRGLLNIKIQEVTPQMAEAMNFETEEGVLVVEVDPKGAGGKAGLKSGDIIVSIDDVKVKNSRKLRIMVAETPINTKIKIGILRHGVKKELECKITESESSSSTKPGKQTTEKPYSGKSFETHGVVFREGNDSDEDGAPIVMVENVKPHAEWRGIMRGDILLSVNQSPVADIRSFEELYNKAVKDGKKHIVLFVKRQSHKLFLALPI